MDKGVCGKEVVLCQCCSKGKGIFISIFLSVHLCVRIDLISFRLVSRPFCWHHVTGISFSFFGPLHHFLRATEITILVMCIIMVTWSVQQQGPGGGEDDTALSSRSSSRGIQFTAVALSLLLSLIVALLFVIKCKLVIFF
jgi:hypothetical protein